MEYNFHLKILLIHPLEDLQEVQTVDQLVQQDHLLDLLVLLEDHQLEDLQLEDPLEVQQDHLLELPALFGTKDQIHGG